MFSLTVKPRPAASAAFTPQSAALADMYSRAQLFVPIEMPPCVIAAIPIECAICSSECPRSLAAATTPPKATIWEAWTPPLPPTRASPIRPAAS